MIEFLSTLVTLAQLGINLLVDAVATLITG